MSGILDSRVIGGDDARPGAGSWQAGLYLLGEFDCGGSLVTPEWIITAAHCILPKSRPFIYKVTFFLISRSREGFSSRLKLLSKCYFLT